jgi:hypothetical protein
MLARIRNPKLDEIAAGQVWEPGMVLFCIRKIGPNGVPGETVAELPVRIHPDWKDNRTIVEALLKQFEQFGEDARSILGRMRIVVEDGDYTELANAA